MRCLCLPFFISGCSRSLTTYGCYGTLPVCLSCFLLLHSISSLIPCPQHFYPSVPYLCHLLLYLLILSLHLVLFSFPTLPLNYLLNLFSWLIFPRRNFLSPPTPPLDVLHGITLSMKKKDPKPAKHNSYKARCLDISIHLCFYFWSYTKCAQLLR